MPEENQNKRKNSIKKKGNHISSSKMNVKNTSMEEVMPYNDELPSVVDSIFPYEDKSSSLTNYVIPYNDLLSTVVDETSHKKEDSTPNIATNIISPVKDIVNEENQRKPSGFLYLIVALLVVAMIVIGILSYFFPDNSLKEGVFIRIGNYKDRIIYDAYYPISSEEEFYSLFPREKIEEIDFDYYDYILLGFENVSCSNNSIHPTDYTLEDGEIFVSIDFENSCEHCKPDYTYYLLKLDKNTYFSNVRYTYHATNDSECPSY